MLDKLMRLPVIKPGQGYLCVDANGNLGGVTSYPLHEFLTLDKIFALLDYTKIEVRIEKFVRDNPFGIDDERLDNYKLRVAIICELSRDGNFDVPTEMSPLFERSGTVVIAKAGVCGPSIEAIMAYVDRL